MLLLHILSFFPCKASCLYNYLDFETNSNVPSSWPYVLGGKRVNCSWSFGVKRGDNLHTKPARGCKDERKKTDQQERLQKKEGNRRPRVLFSKHKWTVPCQLIPIMGLFYTRCGLLKWRIAWCHLKKQKCSPSMAAKWMMTPASAAK